MSIDPLYTRSTTPRSLYADSPYLRKSTSPIKSPDLFEFLFEGRSLLPELSGPLYFKTSQMDCSGNYDMIKAIKLISKSQSSLRDFDVYNAYFETSNTSDYVSGGTCSAMSFNFIRSYLNQPIHFSPRSKIDNIKYDFESSCDDFRLEQAILNTIKVKPTSKDTLLEKVRALSAFYDFKVIDQSYTFYFDHELGKRFFLESFNSLTQGAYLIRVIQPHDYSVESIVKQEKCGHSMALVIESDSIYFYDPDHGIYKLPEENPGEFLFDEIAPMAKLCRFSNGAFFKLD